MSFKNLLLSASLLATAPVFAATYYVTPEGAGEKTGADTANALDVAGFVNMAATCVNGDTFHFAEGTYLFPKTATFDSKGVFLIGSTEGRTIFSGDTNGDGIASSGDLKCLVFIKAAAGATTSPARPAGVENIEFTCSYQSSQDSGDSAQGALSICNTWEASVKNCKFYNNCVAGSYGGAALYANRSNVTVTDSEFSNNKGTHRGGAVRLTNDNPAKGTYSFSNCVFKNNSVSNTRGGAICVMAAKEVNINNCVFADNKSMSMGAAIFHDVDYRNTANDKISPNAMTIANTTIAGNITASDNEGDALADNGQIYVDRRSDRKNSLILENNIVVSNQEITKDIYLGFGDSKTTAENCQFTFISNGYNVVGTTYATGEESTAAESSIITMDADAADTVFDWQPTDHTGSDYTYAYVFGDNMLNDNNQLVPVTYIEGKDGKTPGAVNLEQSEITTGVGDILGDSQVGGLTLLGGGLYQIDGVSGIEAYSVSGAKAAVVAGDTIDLNGLNGGIYILRAGNKSYKVIK